MIIIIITFFHDGRIRIRDDCTCISSFYRVMTLTVHRVY